MNISNNLILTMVKIGNAINKGATEDTKYYLRNCDTITMNAKSYVRADKINTNLSRMVAGEEIDIKIFTRSSWKGALVIDRGNKSLFAICTKNTFDRAIKPKVRSTPYYAQTLVNMLNKSEIAEVKQLSLADSEGPFKYTFDEEDYEKDFFAIMNESSIEYEGYRFWVVVYEVESFVLRSLSAKLLDKDFDMVQEVSILEYLKPNFADLTSEDLTNEKRNDLRSLISVKEGISTSVSKEPEMHIEITPKTLEETKKA